MIYKSNISTSHNSNELEYGEEIRACLADSGVISDRERRILERLRKVLGISEERAKKIEAEYLSSQLSENEKEYAEEISACLSDNGTISDRERRILDKLRRSLAITSDRAYEIEAMISSSALDSFKAPVSDHTPIPVPTSLKQESYPIKSYHFDDLIEASIIEKLKINEDGYEVEDDEEWGEEIVRINWNHLLSSINDLLGLKVVVSEIQSNVGSWGNSDYIRSMDYEYDLQKYIYIQQFSSLVNSCKKERWIDESNVQENQIDWERLNYKLRDLYGISMKRWQITDKGTCPNITIHRMIQNISTKVGYGAPLYHLRDICN